MKFINAEPSLVDRFIQDPNQTLEAIDSTNEDFGVEDSFSSRADELVEKLEQQGELNLPVVETKDVLASFGVHVITSVDEEAVEFMIVSGISKLWKHAYRDEATAVAQAEAFQQPGYGEQVKNRFRDE